MSSKINFSMGDISISIDKNQINEIVEIPPSYSPFINTGTSDISLRLHPGNPRISDARKVFENEPIWTLHRSNRRFILNIYDNMPGIERTLVFATDLNTADLYFRFNSGSRVYPFIGPTIELLVITYLAQGRGVILHSSGIEVNQEGYLFIGESGAGKSTLSRLWDEEKGIDVLSDDRIIVRKKGDHFWMYGTPWHGESKFVSPRGVKLKKMFFLRHAEQNEIHPLNAVDSVQQLLQCSFPPFWDAKGVNFTLELFSELATAVSCCELDFKPDRSVIDFLLMND